MSDPAHGLVIYNKEEFIKCWASTQQNGEPAGIALLLEPTAEFYKEEGEKVNKTGTVHNKVDWEGVTRLSELGHSINFSEEFQKDVHKLRVEEFPSYRFNPYYFPDQGHGSRFLHKVATDKLIEYIELNNLINTIVN